MQKKWPWQWSLILHHNPGLCFLGMVGCFSMTQKNAIRDDRPPDLRCVGDRARSGIPAQGAHVAQPILKRKRHGKGTELRCPDSEMGQKIQKSEAGWWPGVFVFKKCLILIAQQAALVRLLHETRFGEAMEPWNSELSAGPFFTMCFCMAFTALLYMSDGRNVRTKPWPSVGLPVWKLMAGTHLNRFGATLTLLRIWVVEGLPVFEVPCQNMFKRRLEGSSSTRTIEKKTRRFPRNMDSKIWIYPETWLKPKIHSKQHGFSPSKSDVKEIFLTPWDVGHRHKTNRPWHQSPGLSEIPRLHEHHPEAKPGEISMWFLKWISSI